MKHPESCKIKYLGFGEPKTPNELKLEIAGLENLVAKAKERITALRQSLLLAEIIIEESNQEKK
jgi:hypothetical protein